MRKLLFLSNSFYILILLQLFTHLYVQLCCSNILSIECKQHVEMLEKNILAPYRFIHQNTIFHFCFNYAKVEDCLSQILQLHRAASLITIEQNAMVIFFYLPDNMF